MEKEIDKLQVAEKLRSLAADIEERGSEVIYYKRTFTDDPSNEKFEVCLSHKLINKMRY